jgi:hypothetical protein
MLKQLEALEQELIILNNKVNKSILSDHDLTILRNTLNSLLKLKDTLKDLNFDFSRFPDEVSLADLINADQVIFLLMGIYQTLSEGILLLNKMRTFTGKMVCNYREQWEKIHKNNK